MSDTDRLGDALQALADHPWSCHKPELDAVQVEELLRVLGPVLASQSRHGCDTNEVCTWIAGSGLHNDGTPCRYGWSSTSTRHTAGRPTSVPHDGDCIDQPDGER